MKGINTRIQEFNINNEYKELTAQALQQLNDIQPQEIDIAPMVKTLKENIKTLQHRIKELNNYELVNQANLTKFSKIKNEYEALITREKERLELLNEFDKIMKQAKESFKEVMS